MRYVEITNDADTERYGVPAQYSATHPIDGAELKYVHGTNNGTDLRLEWKDAATNPYGSAATQTVEYYQKLAPWTTSAGDDPAYGQIYVGDVIDTSNLTQAYAGTGAAQRLTLYKVNNNSSSDENSKRLHIDEFNGVDFIGKDMFFYNFADTDYSPARITGIERPGVNSDSNSLSSTIRITLFVDTLIPNASTGGIIRLADNPRVVVRNSDGSPTGIAN